MFERCDGALPCGCACGGSKAHLPGPHFILDKGHTCERSWDALMKKHQWLIDLQPADNPYAFPRWGFECGLGWYFILDKAFEQYRVIYEASGIYPIIDQIKEKFGTMRFYASFHDNRDNQDRDQWFNIAHFVSDNAEHKSETACEKCGGRAKTHTDGWYVTLCNTHMEEEKK